MRANSFLIDAVIALSVVYKAFDNMDGFQRFFGFQPNTKIAVLVFGLFHGFGLATKLQELALSRTGLIANIISFNVGVEIGQVLALSAVLILLSYWRMQGGFQKHAFVTNCRPGMTGGLILLSYQLTGYFTSYKENSMANTMTPANAVAFGAPSKQQILKATLIALARGGLQ